MEGFIVIIVRVKFEVSSHQSLSAGRSTFVVAQVLPKLRFLSGFVTVDDETCTRLAFIWFAI